MKLCLFIDDQQPNEAWKQNLSMSFSIIIKTKKVCILLYFTINKVKNCCMYIHTRIVCATKECKRIWMRRHFPLFCTLFNIRFETHKSVKRSIIYSLFADLCQQFFIFTYIHRYSAMPNLFELFFLLTKSCANEYFNIFTFNKYKQFFS